MDQNLRKPRSKGRIVASVAAIFALGLGFSALSAVSASAATGGATHFSVSAASPQIQGAPFSISVTALDGSNAPVGGAFTDTVKITSSDPAATLPANSTLSSGSGTFSVTLNTVGTWTVVATDVSDGSVVGSTSVTVNAANTATHFLVSAPTSVTQGVAFSFTVQALNAGGTQASYSGTVSFSSSDPLASLPAPVVLDSGIATFSATLNTLGGQTISATDGTISGSASLDVLAASVTQSAVRFSVVAPQCVTPGVPFTVTVTALNADGSVDTLYTGIVHLSSSDPLASFSADASLTSGSGAFSVIVGSSGAQSVTATDTVTAISGSTTVVNCQTVVPVQPQPSAPTPIVTQAQFTG